jgi:hypothetical protein
MPIYGGFIAGMNSVLSIAVKQGSRWMKFRNITSEAKFQMTMTFLLQFLNTCLPHVMINLNLSSVEWITRVQKELFFDFAGPR